MHNLNETHFFESFYEKGNRLPSETALAYEYFKLYRDMFSEERSLRDLCEREVNGKKRSISQMGRWSKEEHSLRALCHLEVTGKKRSERVFKRWSREERSLRALCHLDVTGKKRSKRVFKRWSSEHNWQERVATYDAEVELSFVINLSQKFK